MSDIKNILLANKKYFVGRKIHIPVVKKIFKVHNITIVFYKKQYLSIKNKKVQIQFVFRSVILFNS